MSFMSMSSSPHSSFRSTFDLSGTAELNWTQSNAICDIFSMDCCCYRFHHLSHRSLIRLLSLFIPLILLPYVEWSFRFYYSDSNSILIWMVSLVLTMFLKFRFYVDCLRTEFRWLPICFLMLVQILILFIAAKFLTSMDTKFHKTHCSE